MIITDIHDPAISIGISNEFGLTGKITIDIMGGSRIVILDLQKTKNLITHLQSMVNQYEGKGNNFPTPR